MVIILCFLVTSSTPFEHMLDSSEAYFDSRTGQKCAAPLNDTRLADLLPDLNISTTASTVVRDYDEIAFGLEQMQLVPEARNSGHRFMAEDAESPFCIKVGVTLFSSRLRFSCGPWVNMVVDVRIRHFNKQMFKFESDV